MLLSSRPPSPRIPLCVLYVADGSSHQLSTVIEGLQLDGLLSDGLLSDYRVYTLGSDVTAHTTLSNVRASYLLTLLFLVAQLCQFVCHTSVMCQNGLTY